MAAIIVAAHQQKKKSRPWLKGKSSAETPNLVELHNPRVMRPVEIMQLNFRAHRNPQRLHRKNLAERLKFESTVLVGTARLLNQIMVFALLVGALRLSSDEVTKRGIYADLGEAFDFEWLNSIQSREQFVNEALPALAAKSKEYFTLSSRYFQPDGVGSTMLLREISLFSAPRPGPRITLQTPHFSFTAWVRTQPQFTSGYVVRKRGVATGEGAELSCWGWYLDAARGPELHYGSHDFFDTANSPFTPPAGPRQVEVGLAPGVALEAGRFSMLTMIVDQHSATFYQDRSRLGSQPLPRRVTDCFNNEQGTLLGAASLELGVVRYFPEALSESSIEELFSTGGILADLSTGSDPATPSESELEAVERTLSSSLSGLDAALAARQPLSHLALTLQTIQDTAQPRVLSPAAPTGVIDVPPNTTVDTLNPNRSFTQLVEGPWLLTETAGAEGVHRTLRGAPSFRGTGATIMMWYRHMACAEEFCGVFALTARAGLPEAGLCWSLWVEDNGIWFDNLLADPQFQYPRGFVADKFRLSATSWRHLAMVFDETSDQIRWYMDGHLAVTAPWGSPVTAADCQPGPDTFITLGRSFPGYTHGAEIEVHDLRMYVHPRGRPLQGDEIRRVAEAATPGLSERERCLPVSSPVMQDSDWTDAFGHDCSWFHHQRRLNPAVCDMPEAAEQCPIACKSRQECLSSSQPEVFFSWDRIRKIERRADGGTLCLHDHDSAEAAVQRCREWVAAHPDPDPLDPMFQPWLESFTEARGQRVDLRDCDRLRDAVDPHCSFDADAVRQFTRGVVAEGGDFTMAFWVRPTAAGSLVDGKFIPHVQFYAGLSPPTHNMAWGLWSNANGEARLFSSCGTGDRDIYENIEMKAAADGEWTFLALTRSNSSTPTVTTVATNLGRSSEESTLPVCLYDADALFSAVEFNYDMLVSPIMMVPGALPLGAVQELYFTQAQAVQHQTGPRVSNAEREERARIRLDKQDFEPRSVLTAPPIIFQTRIDPTPTCDFDYASDFIAAMHRKVQDSKCAPPYLCDDDVLAMPERTLACPGGPKRQGTLFGLSPNDFNSQLGYADFLYSVVDNRFLFREGQPLPTSTFISSLTESVSVTLVFFTPKFGTTSLMTLSAEFQGAAAAEVQVSLQHFEILEGADLRNYLVVQSIVLVSIAIMILDVSVNTSDLLLRARRDGALPVAGVVKQVTDTATCVMVIVFVALRIPSKMASASKTTELVGGLAQIPWDALDVALETKKSDFFALVVQLTTLIATESDLSAFCNIILIVSLLRVIQCTDLHPRLALLTGTLKKATDDLFHAALLIGMLMGCFAGIATWRFGSELEAFGTFPRTMQTQFEMLFGSFPADWQGSTDLMVYTILYIIILFLLVQNFLLAIIVEAYMKVREENERLQTESSFVEDVWNSSYAYFWGRMRGWPSPWRLGCIVETWTCKISVGLRELHTTGLFRSMADIGPFLEHYRGFDFLQPDTVRNHYFFEEPSTEDKVAHRVMAMLGKQPTLREQADRVVKLMAARRKTKRGKRRGSTGSITLARVEPDPDTPPRFVGRASEEAAGASPPSEVTAATPAPNGSGFLPQAGAGSGQAAAVAVGVNMWQMREEMERKLEVTNASLTAVRTELHGVNRRLEDHARRVDLAFHHLIAALTAPRPDDPNPRSAQPPEPSIPTPYPFTNHSAARPSPLEPE